MSEAMVFKTNVEKILTANVSDSLKDFATPYGIANGEDDLILELETLRERFTSRGTEEGQWLMSLIRRADQDGAEYIHLY
jgi:hypothetical protein